MSVIPEAVIVPPLGFNELLARWMEAHQGKLEIWGRNDGPDIRTWLSLVHLAPGNEWCAATVHAGCHYVSLGLEIENPCPQTGGSLKMWRKSDPATHVITPRRGCIGVLDHGKGKGHVIVCTRELTEDVGLTWASGNTNAAGSRTGDSLLVKTGDPEEVHHGELVGWFDLSRLPPRPLVA